MSPAELEHMRWLELQRLGKAVDDAQALYKAAMDRYEAETAAQAEHAARSSLGDLTLVREHLAEVERARPTSGPMSSSGIGQ